MFMSFSLLFNIRELQAWGLISYLNMNFTSAVSICKKNQLGKNTPAYNIHYNIQFSLTNGSKPTRNIENTNIK